VSPGGTQPVIGVGRHALVEIGSGQRHHHSKHAIEIESQCSATFASSFRDALLLVSTRALTTDSL